MVGNSTDGEGDRTKTDDRSTETDERESNPEAETE